jgi:hypothetical protein
VYETALKRTEILDKMPRGEGGGGGELISIGPHLYADDTQVFGSCPPSEAARLHSQLVSCVEDVASWTKANRLQLNAANTEVLWCSSRRQMHQLPIQPLTACGSCISPASLVRDLGVWIDSGLTMSPHVVKTAAGCFAVLRQLRSVRRSLSRESLISLVFSLVLTRLDYCNAVLAGLPNCQIDRLQSVINTAARLIFSARRCDHVTPLLAQLHWLPVRERIDFKLCVLILIVALTARRRLLSGPRFPAGF